MVSHLAQDAHDHDTAVLFLASLTGYETLSRMVRGQALTRVRLDASKHEDYADISWTVIKQWGRLPGQVPKGTFQVKDGKIDRMRELVELATARGIITRKRSWYYYRSRKLGNGLTTVVTKLKLSSDTTAQEIEMALRNGH
jgi:hypothetical protein